MNSMLQAIIRDAITQFFTHTNFATPYMTLHCALLTTCVLSFKTKRNYNI